MILDINKTKTFESILPLERKYSKLRLNKLAIHERNRIMFVDYQDIVYCKSDGNYAYVNTCDGETIMVSKCLKNLQESIKDRFFVRVHASFLVNLRYLEEIRKGGNLTLVINGLEIPVSRSKTEALMSLF